MFWRILFVASLALSCCAQSSNLTEAPAETEKTPSGTSNETQTEAPAETENVTESETETPTGTSEYDFTCYPEEVPLCKAICIGENETCPELASCNASGEASFLCMDGTCVATENDCDPEAASPCECGGTACAMLESGYLDVCDEKFGDLYEAADANCPSSQVSLNQGGFVGPVVWTVVVAVLACAYTWINQRLCSNSKPTVVQIDRKPTTGNKQEPKEQKELDETEVMIEEKDVDGMDPYGVIPQGCVVQIGYKNNIIGTFLYLCVILTGVLFQVLMAFFCINYYGNDLTETIDGVDVMTLPEFWRPIPDEEQVLYVFEIIWMVAAFWDFMIYSQSDVRALYRRRSNLRDADVVEVWAPSDRKLLQVDDSGVKCMETCTVKSKAFMAGVFSICCHGARYPKNEGTSTICHVQVNPSGDRVITFQLRRYVYNPKTDAFEPGHIPMPTSRAALLDMQGLTSKEAEIRMHTIGPNVIDISKPTVLGVLVKEFSAGFYVYQTFMAWTWFNFSYWHMGILLYGTIIVGGLSVAYVSYSQQNTLHSLVSTDKGEVNVLRDGKWVKILTSGLVPGDVIALEPGAVSCDMVVIQGKPLTDESSLTGESMPVQKEALDGRTDGAYDSHTNKKSSVWGGTTLLQLVEGKDVDTAPRGLVLTTGGNTDKGKQMRTILYESNQQFKFDVQVKLVVAGLAAYAIFGFWLVIYFLADTLVYGWFYGMYVVAAALPPLLPTVFVVSIGISTKRLLARGVVCSNPARLLMAGKVRVFCFDKTGTLTQQGLNYFVPKETKEQSWGNPDLIPSGMASCHSLSNSAAGLIGNSVDIKMFEASGWSLQTNSKGHDTVTSKTTKEELSIVHRFDFDHARMTMSVVVRDSSGNHRIFCKGSAESVAKVSNHVPAGFFKAAEGYAREGCYTLALASRHCTGKEEKLFASGAIAARDKVEAGMELLGFMLFKNELKPDSAQAIKLLQAGAVRCIMLTGDHILTGIHVAKSVGMVFPTSNLLVAVRVKDGGEIEWTDEDEQPRDLPVDCEAANVELAIGGKVWKQLNASGQITALLPHIRIFARMSPTEKLGVINAYTSQGFITGMCGDGGNDCNALRAAHVGVALSDAEASVVSPFTGISKSCMSVVDVLLEGRCGLASAFAAYKFMLLYGQIGAFNQIINAYFAVTFSDWNWLFIDGFWVICLAFALALSKPAATLSTERPPSSLLGLQMLISVGGTLFIHFIFLCIALACLKRADFYQCRTWDPNKANVASLDSVADNYESEVIYIVTGAEYIASAAAFNFGGKHRAAWIKNYVLMFFLIVFYILHLVMLLVPSTFSCAFRANCDNDHIIPSLLTGEPIPIQNAWGTTLLPYDFRIALLIIIIVNVILVCVLEKLVMDGPIRAWLRRSRPSTRYLRM